MSFITMWNGKLIKMLDNEEQTDCIFQLKSSLESSEEENGSKHELVRAHKLVLSAASEVLKRMLSKEWTSNEKPVLIEDIDAALFKVYIRTIYTKILSVNDLETVIDLHKLAHMYETDDVLELTTNYMIKNCNEKNVLAITDVAWTFGNKKLRNSCKLALAKHATEILNSQEFLESRPMSVNKLFSLKALNIASENLLVTSLDKYIDNDLTDIIPKLKLAIESIRILLVTNDIINKCSNEDFKAILFERKRKFSDAPNVYYFKQGMGHPRDKPTILSRLPPIMLQKLFRSIIVTYCPRCSQDHCDISCPKFKPKVLSPNIVSIYNKYKHEHLAEYSDDDIKAILEAFKIAAISEGSTSEFYGFVNYEIYFET